jgi:putative SOS response-associated peptidase YedK
MCGRFSLGASATQLIELFSLTEAPAWGPRYNIAPTQEVLVILKSPEHPNRQVRRRRWGLIPSWAKDRGIGNQLINAQAETAATKPAFRVAFRKRRCLILADGFYEWKKEGRQKQPFHIRLRDGRPFGFAGLWEHWEGGEAAAIDSCTILTTIPNDLLRPLHHRMAVILAPEDYDLWLDPAIQEVDRLQPLLRPYPAEAMTAYPVSTRVNSPANDQPECVEPIRKG